MLSATHIIANCVLPPAGKRLVDFIGFCLFAFFENCKKTHAGWGEAVRELKSDTSESCDLKAISEIAIENEAFSSKNSLKNAVEYRDNFQSVSSRHLENEFLDGLGEGWW